MTDINSNLRLNMTGAEADPTARSLRYRTAIEMAEYADGKGFAHINLEEHHVADNGWLPSPLIMASAIAARTNKANISVVALLASLYDPIRLAEDIAVIDLLSEGRFSFVAGMGYREIEFHIANKPYDERGVWMDHVLETLLSAWTEQAFEYRGRMVNVTPKPLTHPHPNFLVGGMSRPAARRAARLGLPFAPPVSMPDLEKYYYEQLREYGKGGYVYAPPPDFSVLFIHEDPDKAWTELGQYFLNEVQEYSSWQVSGLERVLETSDLSVEALRREGTYEIITPDECLQRHRDNPQLFALIHPLVGGIPLAQAWNCLELYSDKVLARLN